MKIYKKYTVYSKIQDGLDKAGRKKFKKVPEIRRIEVHPSEIISTKFNPFYMEDKIKEMMEIIQLMLLKSKEEVIKELAGRINRHEGFYDGKDWIDEYWEWEFEE